MKIAISGKGGVGKTTLAAGLAIFFSRQEKKVFAIDADPDANLALSLGFPHPSQIKPLIDRHFCLVKNDGTSDHKSLISGKPAALLVTCAGPIEANCDAIQ